MQNKKYKLPEREWFSLTQAVEKIKNITGEEITESDLIYYASKGFIEMAVYLYFDINSLEEGRFSISNRKGDINENTMSFEIRGFSSNDNVTIHKGKYADFYYDNLIFQEINPELRIFYINGYKIRLNSNVNKLKGFFAIDFIEFDRLVLDERNLSISTYDVMFRFCRSEKYTNNLGFTIRVWDKELNDSLFINSNDIFITKKEINNFLNGKQIRTLRTMEDFIEEWNEPTRHSQEDEIEINHNEETEKKEPPKNKGGRPQNPLKDKAIKIARETASYYNNEITRLELASRIADYLRTKYNAKIAEETVKKYLTEQNIGNRKGTVKNFKIIDTE